MVCSSGGGMTGRLNIIAVTLDWAKILDCSARVHTKFEANQVRTQLGTHQWL